MELGVKQRLEDYFWNADVKYSLRVHRACCESMNMGAANYT